MSCCVAARKVVLGSRGLSGLATSLAGRRAEGKRQVHEKLAGRGTMSNCVHHFYASSRSRGGFVCCILKGGRHRALTSCIAKMRRASAGGVILCDDTRANGAARLGRLY